MGPGGLLAHLTRQLVERAMSTELTSTWALSAVTSRPAAAGTPATVRRRRRLRPSTSRWRSRSRGIPNGTFEAQIVRKGQRRFEGFDDKILALYARGLSTRDIEADLAEIYDVKVGRDLIAASSTGHRRPARAVATARRRLPGAVP